MVDFYLTSMRTQISSQFQYRAAAYMYLLGMVAEPVIYLVVWTTIAEDSGGTVGGLTAGDFAAYYIVWTLVRNMNLVFTPFGWEWRIRDGELSGWLLRPLHPIHYDIAGFAGSKIPWLLFYLPIAVVLTLVFDPTFDVRAAEIAVFAVAIWGAYLIRSFNQGALGLVCFWTTRVSALFSLYIMVELLLSGRLVPMTLMPDWVQTLAWFLPFQWTFFFPIETLVGDYSNTELLRGLGMQVFWILVGIAIFSLVWRHADSSLHGGEQLMQTLRVALLHLRVGVMTDLQYRVNFALQVLQSLLALATGLVVFSLVYSHTTELNGWSQNELLVVLGVQIVMGGVIRAVVQPNMMRFTEEVRDGKLDHALTKPVDAQMLVSVRQVEVWQAVDMSHGSRRDRRGPRPARRRPRAARRARVRDGARGGRRPSLLLLDRCSRRSRSGL